MRAHAAADLGLLADEHALEYLRVSEPERAGNRAVQGREGGGAERRGQFVQVVADFVDGAVLGLREVPRGGGEGVFFEEEAHLVAAG